MTLPVHQSGELVLASGSPRRHELLTQLGMEFTVAPADIDESVRAGETPETYVKRMAEEKAAAGLLSAAAGSCVMGADTSVVIGEQILGKPSGRDEALSMLTMLAEKTHQVYSAVALTNGARSETVMSVTDVCFGPIAPATAAAYWATGEPADKAGAYAIQGKGALFVKSINGSYSGVVGLPLFETAQLLRGFGFRTGFQEGDT